MAEKDVVRITFKELETIVRSSYHDYPREENVVTKGNNRHHRKPKRPEQAIYRPRHIRGSKDRDTSLYDDRTKEEENWESEIDPVRTTDEDSSRDSKENSVDKEVEGGFDEKMEGGPSSSDRNKSGQRRSKRPDIKLYVPKGRIQEHEFPLDEDIWEGDAGISKTDSLADKVSSPGSNEPPRKVDLDASFGALQVTVVDDHSSEPSIQQQEDNAINDIQARKDEYSYRQELKYQDSSPAVANSKERGGRKRQEDQDKKKGKEDIYMNKNICEQPVNRRDSQQKYKGSSQRWEEKNGGVRCSDREERSSGRGKYFHNDGRNGTDDGSDADAYAHVQGEHRSGMGRGRQRHPNYHRSSSNESLTKSVDMGQRSARWPVDSSPPQHSGTFPRAKSGKNRGRGAGTDNKQPVGRGRGAKHTFSTMQRQRERSGSFSSDTSGGSDMSWEDLEAEMEEAAANKPDWNTQVEQHLEQVARQVQDSTQRLTDNIESCFDPFAINSNAEWQGKPQKNAQSGLNRNLSSSSDHIFSQEYRGRKKESHHKGPRSKNSSRESSIHSNPCDNDPWPTEEKKPRKRHRRRHSSAGPGGRVGTVEGQRAAESLRILVGKNKEKRQVVLDGKPGSKGGTADIHAPNVGNGQHRRQRQHSSSEQHKKGAEHFHPHREKHRDYGSGDKSGINQIAERRKSDHHGSVHSIGDSDRKTQGPRTHQDSRDDYAHTQSQSHQSHHQDTKLQINNNQQTQGTLSRFSSAPANSLENASSHHGGLIKLPPESQANKSHQTHNHGYNHGYNQSHSYGKGFGQGQEYGEDSFRRGFSQGHTSFQGQNGSQVYNSGPSHGERHLFDPKNPSKPIMVPDPRPLKFVDPEETHSPQDSFTPPPHVHSPGPVVSPGMGPAFPSFLPPHPSFMYPPHMPMPYPGFPCAPPPGHPVPHPMFYGFQPHPRLSMENGAYQDESYYNREVEQMMPGMSRPQCRMMAEQILRDSAPLDCQLGNILSRGQLGEDGERRVKQLRQELQRRYEKIILLDIDVASQRGVEQQLWRSVYYNIIEGLRRQSSDASGNDSTAKQTLLEILDEGTSFYESLLNKLQSTYSISLESLLEEGSATEGSGRGCRLAILSAQRTMMFLGDIARYREQASHTANYGKARHWYMRAQKLAPKNGRPYNQLAILAVYTRRKLDAVYYYQRSLAASNPILTARESLMSLFDEVRRKEEAVEQKRLEEARQRRRRRGALPQSRPRVEVWIAPDGSSSRDPFDNISSDDDDLSSLSAIELNKRFVLTFLNVHGKLFTKINFEVFVESASLMLQEWRLLLQHSPTVISSMRMLQIMAINMFSIDSTALKDESLEASCRSLLQEHAVEVGLDMFGILVARVTELFEFHLNSPQSPQQLMSDDLRQLLPGVKLWVDWMMCHSCLWNPQPSLRPPDIGPVVNVWQNVAQLCNMLKRVNTSQVHHFPDRCEGCEPLVLMEDTMMAGFVPLLSAPVDTVYVKAGEDKEIAQDCMRLEKIVLFGEYLCGIEPPMLSFDVENGRYYSVAPAPVRSEEKLAGSDLEQGAKTADVIIESEESGEDGDEMPGEAIQKLKARKAELSRRVEAQARDKHTLQTLVEEGRPAKLEMEVRPRFLVTDTNCLIDHLPALRSMLSAGTFTVVVPLVVLNELDGLAKGNRNVTGRGGHSSDESPEHASMVMRHASHALDFLESEFKSKNSHLRVQTSKGSILDSLAFRSEESDSSGNNDDLILSCCLHYCKDMARDFMPRDKDSPVRLFRDVVLLTDDRNLRLKAHTSNVPVKDVPAFCRWSKVT